MKIRSFVSLWLFVLASLFVAENTALAQESAEADSGEASGLNAALGDKLSLKVGAGIRSSFRMGENEGDGNNWGTDTNLDNARLYFSGSAFDFLRMELNTDVGNAQGFEDPSSTFEEAGNMRILDMIGKVELHDYFNVWIGRMLPPSDRSNLSGPYYLNAYDFPYVQFSYPNIFQGRDDGISYWGQFKEGLFKWQLGVFEGFTGRGAGEPNDEDNLLYTGRLTLNLLDPEPGYYNSSTYFGDKDVLAFGVAGMHQRDAVGTQADPRDYTGFSLDFLFELPLTEERVGKISGLTDGVFTLESAYYDFDLDDAAEVDPAGNFTPLGSQGESYFVLVSYLVPYQIGYGPMQGRPQPFFRYLDYRRSTQGKAALSALNQGALEEGFDAGMHYVIDGHNAKFTLAYQQRDRGRGQNKLDTVLMGIQLQM